ncbi:unnamed protein product [Symbiodinium sp. CCMP2456]|nr:unnamed protein product [Symbiodinium sp. CCMP2456]
MTKAEQKKAVQFTRMCKFWQTNECKMGAECTFAHETTELRPSPKPCFDFAKKGICTRGDACRFAHQLGPKAKVKVTGHEMPNATFQMIPPYTPSQLLAAYTMPMQSLDAPRRFALNSAAAPWFPRESDDVLNQFPQAPPGLDQIPLPKSLIGGTDGKDEADLCSTSSGDSSLGLEQLPVSGMKSMAAEEMMFATASLTSTMLSAVLDEMAVQEWESRRLLGQVKLPLVGLETKPLRSSSWEAMTKAEQKKAVQFTRMCKFWRTNECKMGAECTFAHETTELRPSPKPCFDFAKKGVCTRGDACRFVHQLGPKAKVKVTGHEMPSATFQMIPPFTPSQLLAAYTMPMQSLDAPRRFALNSAAAPWFPRESDDVLNQFPQAPPGLDQIPVPASLIGGSVCMTDGKDEADLCSTSSGDSSLGF